MKTDLHWKRIGLRSHHGICTPLSALRTHKSCGIGEFLDLIPLIDFCKKVGFDTIQLLPLNDTGNDPSPYNPISSCALDPVYISLPDHALDACSELNQLPRIAFTKTKQIKFKWLYSQFKQNFPSISKSPAYIAFLQENPWLLRYALFKSLQDEYSGISWRHWPVSSQFPNDKDAVRHKHLIDFYSYLQFLCFTQMEQVRAYASEQKIFLKGDIPILLSPNSADVWENPSLFHLEFSAGSPPDYYNPLGQKWGFPLFNWDAMEANHFAFWKQRLSVATRLFHIYRIDHVVGFFRIWAIRENEPPTNGFFIPEDWHLWADQGRKLLSMMIEASPMLPIAEDLGTIPREVPPILKELGICSTNVIRWKRYWDGDHNFIPLSEYDPLSLTTVSTPDSDTLQTWWQKYPEEAKFFALQKGWTYTPNLTKEERFSLLYDAHHSPSYFHINLLQEYLALFPELISNNPEEERINIPGTVAQTNWTYRFRPSIEEMLKHQSLLQAMQQIIDKSCAV